MKYETNRTRVGLTDTISGPIPHLAIVHAGGTFAAPVKLVTAIRDRHGKCEPQRQGDQLVYALPGGGELLGPEVMV